MCWEGKSSFSASTTCRTQKQPHKSHTTLNLIHIMKQILSCLCFTLVAVSTVSAGTLYRPGFLQTQLSGSMDKTTPLTGNVRSLNALMAYSVNKQAVCAYDGLTYSWADNRTFGYVSQMYVTQGTTYKVGKYLDDSGRIILDGQTLLDNSDCNAFALGTYAATNTGWVSLEIRVGNGGGGAGPTGGSWPNCGLGWNTTGLTTQTPLESWKAGTLLNMYLMEVTLPTFQPPMS